MAQKKSLEKIEKEESTHLISVCDTMHANANSIIEKMESLLPAKMQMYSDFYTEYLHSLQDLFGACYISENEIMSKIGISQESLQSFDAYVKAVTRSAISQIEMANSMQQTFLQNQISAVKIADEYIRLMLDYYSKILASSLDMMKRS